MPHILAGDVAKFIPSIAKVLTVLGDGTKKGIITTVQEKVDLGDGISVAKVIGYWVDDVIKIEVIIT